MTKGHLLARQRGEKKEFNSPKWQASRCKNAWHLNASHSKVIKWNGLTHTLKLSLSPESPPSLGGGVVISAGFCLFGHFLIVDSVWWAKSMQPCRWRSISRRIIDVRNYQLLLFSKKRPQATTGIFSHQPWRWCSISMMFQQQKTPSQENHYFHISHWKDTNIEPKEA